MEMIRKKKIDKQRENWDFCARKRDTRKSKTKSDLIYHQVVLCDFRLANRWTLDLMRLA